MAKTFVINSTSITGGVDVTSDVGASGLKWKDGWFSGTVTVGTVSATGALIAVGSSTLGGLLITDNRNVTLGTGTGTTFATATNQRLAFYGTVAVVQQASLTATVGTVTFSEPTTPDYVIADLSSVDSFGFVTLDEGQSILKVIANLQTRLGELETRLTTYGLLST